MGSFYFVEGVCMKTVFEMAKEAGDEDWGLFVDFMPEIERFAHLVVAAERKNFCSHLAALHDLYSLQSMPIRKRKKP